MKIPKWIAGLLKNRQTYPDFREMQDLTQKAQLLAGVYDYENLTELIRQYLGSEKSIERIAFTMAKSNPFCSPESAMSRNAAEMMDALKDTRYMEKCGHRISDIRVEDENLVHGMLAMYNFMRDAAIEKYQTEGMERPEHDEVLASIRMLDRQRYGEDITELCELAMFSDIPSRYVMMRYGLERHCDACRSINEHITEHDNPRILLQAEADMCRAAERAVEGIDGVKLPEPYLKELDDELHNLGRIAASPDSIDDFVHISPYFLVKYGIDRNATPEEQSLQAQKAYRELDDRIVKATGRRPYADDFLSSLRCKTVNMVERQGHHQYIRNPPPAKGRKLSL